MNDPDMLESVSVEDESDHSIPSPAQAEPDVQTAHEQKKAPFWSRWFSNQHVSLDEVLFELSEAIEQHPKAPTNYLLRGEYYLQIGYNQLAEEDFQQAVRLSELELSKRHWGFVAQVTRDRANRGLEIAQKRLQHSKA
jgi:tetratricopeptide (TPR) repeat protein